MHVETGALARQITKVCAALSLKLPVTETKGIRVIWSYVNSNGVRTSPSDGRLWPIGRVAMRNGRVSMRNKSLAVASIIVLGVATTPSAMALDHASSFGTKRAPYVYAAPGYRWRSGWRVNGQHLPFGPVLSRLYSYGSGHSCNPYDPFTALYGYCGGPYHYDGW
jgi:hypothetical protein